MEAVLESKEFFSIACDEELRPENMQVFFY